MLVRVLSSLQYKYTTFFAEIQIPLTFRNTLATVKMRRFAADGSWRVLYYEELIELPSDSTSQWSPCLGLCDSRY